MSGLRIEGLNKSFGPKTVLSGVDLEVPAGETLAVLGRSGSGKSTLLRCIAFLESSDGGDAWLGGQQILRNGAPAVEPTTHRRRIGVVFQDNNLLPSLTVLKNCTLGPVRAQRRPQNKVEAEARHTLERLGVGDLAERYPATLSGGQAQRVAIARALMLRPELLLLDEVTSALDPDSVGLVLTALAEALSVGTSMGASVLLITHHLRFAEATAGRIAVLEEGAIVESHPSAHFARDVESQVGRSFVDGSLVRGSR